MNSFTFDPIEHVYTLDGKPLTGVTTILSVIAKPALVPWAAKMVSEYIKGNCELKDGAYTVTPEQLDMAKNAHRAKKEDAAEKGTDLHALVESWVNSQITGVVSDMDYMPIEKFIEWARRENVKFLATEKRMYSRNWWIAGTCDLLFEKDGKKYIGDVKTYAKIWDRVPFFQAAGYANMYEEMNEGKDTIAGYCILRLSKDGSFEEKWSFDVVGDTKAFFACVELYRQLQTYKV